MTDHEIALSVGGVELPPIIAYQAGGVPGEPAWNFGLVHPFGPGHFKMAPEEEVTQGLIRGAMPEFSIRGAWAGEQEKVILSDVFKQPVIKDSEAFGGKVFPGFHQLSGSCVGAGSGNAMTILAAVEVAIKGDPEEAFIPWWPYSYGRGRFRGGMTRPGEGSFSEAQVEAFKTDGVVRSDEAGLPHFIDSDGLTLTSAMEIAWSDGDGSQCMPWLDKGRTHLIKTTAIIRNANDAVAALTNGYPILFCGSWGGVMQCPVKGTPGVLLNHRASTWQHNQTCMAYYRHPTLGLLFGVWNQWGLSTHGSDPAGLPPGAYWIAEADFNWQAAQGSCIAISNFDGFPSQQIPWWI